MNDKQDTILKFKFNQFIFKFLAEGDIIVTDLQYRRKYRIQFNSQQDFPFVISMEEKE